MNERKVGALWQGNPRLEAPLRVVLRGEQEKIPMYSPDAHRCAVGCEKRGNASVRPTRVIHVRKPAAAPCDAIPCAMDPRHLKSERVAVYRYTVHAHRGREEIRDENHVAARRDAEGLKAQGNLRNVFVAHLYRPAFDLPLEALGRCGPVILFCLCFAVHIYFCMSELLCEVFLCD